jgi:hypothetical protein
MLFETMLQWEGETINKASGWWMIIDNIRKMDVKKTIVRSSAARMRTDGGENSTVCP